MTTRAAGAFFPTATSKLPSTLQTKLRWRRSWEGIDSASTPRRADRPPGRTWAGRGGGESGSGRIARPPQGGSSQTGEPRGAMHLYTFTIFCHVPKRLLECGIQAACVQCPCCVSGCSTSSISRAVLSCNRSSEHRLSWRRHSRAPTPPRGIFTRQRGGAAGDHGTSSGTLPGATCFGAVAGRAFGSCPSRVSSTRRPAVNRPKLPTLRVRRPYYVSIGNG